MPRPNTSRHKWQEVLTERPVLGPGQTVVKVVRACGENNYEVENENGEKCLYHLPKRLRHVAFIRRGSYVFVKDDPTRGPGKIRGDIEVVVLDRFLNSLRTESFWPSAFGDASQRDASGSADAEKRDDSASASSDDEWEIGGGNPNRRAWDHVGDSSDSS